MPRLRSRTPPDADLLIATASGTPVARIPESVRRQIEYLCARTELDDAGTPDSIGVTSSMSGEGVTFISRALAAVLSETVGKRTCLVEANWLDTKSGVDERVRGLVDVLEGTCSIEDVEVQTRFERLSIVGSGETSAIHGTALSTTERLKAVLAELRSRFDHVVVDLPAVTATSAAISLGAATSGLFLVARQRMIRVDQVERAVADLQHSRFLGVVLNDNQSSMPGLLRRRLIDS